MAFGLRSGGRLLPHIQPLKGRRVLDVGCGNGYYLWQMREAGADIALGIEPHLLNCAQFAVLQRYVHNLAFAVLPMQLEEYPVNSRIYDTVFSMGVLYHRKSPADHLIHCKSCLREGGEFVLETLVVEGDENRVLLPEDRYAKMRNVWNIPSPAYARRLLRRCGFRNPRLVNINRTSSSEQRRTPWMNFESLEDFLDPKIRARPLKGIPHLCGPFLLPRHHERHSVLGGFSYNLKAACPPMLPSALGLKFSYVMILDNPLKKYSKAV